MALLALILGILLLGVALFIVAAIFVGPPLRRSSAHRAQQRREQPATLEGGGSHLSADRRTP